MGGMEQDLSEKLDVAVISRRQNGKNLRQIWKKCYPQTIFIFIATSANNAQKICCLYWICLHSMYPWVRSTVITPSGWIPCQESVMKERKPGRKAEITKLVWDVVEWKHKAAVTKKAVTITSKKESFSKFLNIIDYRDNSSKVSKFISFLDGS